jgi:hypothetical protein
MAASTRSTIERLLDDDLVHEQMSAAAGRVRHAVKRARKLPPREAVQDKKIYDELRHAAGAGVLALRRVMGRDKPVPKRRGRRLVVALAAGAAAAFVAHRRTRSTSGGASPEPLAEA